MERIGRRGFVEAVGATAGSVWLGAMPAAAQQRTSTDDRTVRMSGDGLTLEPHDYAVLLEQLTRGGGIEEDDYLLGGEIDAFEREWADLLGKERAVFMPSGTLANQIALRALAGSRRRVIVQDVSHVYNDTGDACQTLSGLTLLPLGQGRATFTVADVEAVLARTASGRVAADVGAILIESPVRRLTGQMFDWRELQAVTSFARERGIATHLDGARLFMASAYTGLSPREYSAPFDTVYVSLWKYFNSGIGAILAGPRQVLDTLFHTRRMFGGNLASGWPAALVARHFMRGFDDRLRAAVAVSTQFFAGIDPHPAWTVEPVPNGTNLTRLALQGRDAAIVRTRLADAGILVPAASPSAVFTLAVNETWTRRTPAELIAAFEHAAS